MDDLLRWLVTQIADVPVARMSFALMTMHPEVLWKTVQWRNGDVVVRDQPRARLDDPFYTKSAVAVVRSTLAPVRVPLVAGDLPYPVCVDLRAEGCTDYVIYPLTLSNQQVSYISFASTTPGGFTDVHLAHLAALRPQIEQRVELASAYYATSALLEVYLGKNAARRVLAGAFQRGAGELIDCAIWFSDMRGFTELADRVEPSRLIAVLDTYFDIAATAISARGGEVLKFIGDAVLAIFPFADSDPQTACRNALAAARQTLTAIAAFDVDGPQIGIALHRGRVMYGNIGARDRLDFTVISSTVNEASRLEGLCKTLGPLVLSAAFTETAAVDGAIDRGEQKLKGVGEPVRVFTI